MISLNMNEAPQRLDRLSEYSIKIHWCGSSGLFGYVTWLTSLVFPGFNQLLPPNRFLHSFDRESHLQLAKLKKNFV